MKKLKPIFIMTLVSAFAVLTVVNMSLASPRSAGENTLDMLEIMTRAFDESGGGEIPEVLILCNLDPAAPGGARCWEPFSDWRWELTPFLPVRVIDCKRWSGLTLDICMDGDRWPLEEG